MNGGHSPLADRSLHPLSNPHADVALGSSSVHDQNATEVFTGQGTDSSPRGPQRNIPQEVHSKETNGSAKPLVRSNVVIERYRDKDGEHLVSFRPEWDHQKNKARAARRRNSELLSGRRAGARWEQSQYILPSLDIQSIPYSER